MITFENVLALVLAYLIGSIPTAVWIGKYMYGVDVRNSGSGNSGATNTFRVLGKKAGIPVLIIDIFKGWLAVQLAYILGNFRPETQLFENFQFLLGLFAVLGHIFPIFAQFKGGKGIATILGAMIAIHYQAALLSLLVFLIVFLSTHFVSLSSILGSLMFPLSILFIFNYSSPTFVLYSFLVWVLVLATHQKNIERLLSKKESKIYLVKKKK
ncbi:MAG: glycerol-3-phosphate 1-O-acyltransferase PlsY [Bacteroidia bacterium]